MQISWKSAFSIWKSLWMLQKTCITIMACAIYYYLFFSYICTLLFYWKMRSCCDHHCPQQIRLQTNVQLGEGNLIFCCMGSQESFSGWSVGKMIITLSFRVGISKNENIDWWLKETYAIMSTQVTYETNHISLLCDSMMSRVPNFCFLYILL